MRRGSACYISRIYDGPRLSFVSVSAPARRLQSAVHPSIEPSSRLRKTDTTLLRGSSTQEFQRTSRRRIYWQSRSTHRARCDHSVRYSSSFAPPQTLRFLPIRLFFSSPFFVPNHHHPSSSALIWVFFHRRSSSSSSQQVFRRLVRRILLDP